MHASCYSRAYEKLLCWPVELENAKHIRAESCFRECVLGCVPCSKFNSVSNLEDGTFCIQGHQAITDQWFIWKDSKGKKKMNINYIDEDREYFQSQVPPGYHLINCGLCSYWHLLPQILRRFKKRFFMKTHYQLIITTHKWTWQTTRMK